jgi:hypothetical protein
MNQTIRIKRIVPLTAFLSFVLVILNSVALYISPHGRVAYWVDWRFLGLSKTQWADQHIIVGLLFLIALLLHIYYNWNPIVAYLKSKARKIKVFTPDFNIALALTILFTIERVKARNEEFVRYGLTQRCTDGHDRCILRVENTRREKGRYADVLYVKTTSKVRPTLLVYVTGMIH